MDEVRIHLLRPQGHEDGSVVKLFGPLRGQRCEWLRRHLGAHALLLQSIERLRRVIFIPLEHVRILGFASNDPSLRPGADLNSLTQLVVAELPAFQFGKGQVESVGHRPGGDIVKQAVPERRTPLEQRRNESVLVLLGRNEVGAARLKDVAVGRQVCSGSVHLHVVLGQQLGQVVRARPVGRGPEDVSFNGRPAGLSPGFAEKGTLVIE